VGCRAADTARRASTFTTGRHLVNKNINVVTILKASRFLFVSRNNFTELMSIRSLPFFHN